MMVQVFASKASWCNIFECTVVVQQFRSKFYLLWLRTVLLHCQHAFAVKGNRLLKIPEDNPTCDSRAAAGATQLSGEALERREKQNNHLNKLSMSICDRIKRDPGNECAAHASKQTLHVCDEINRCHKQTSCNKKVKRCRNC